MWTKVEVGNEDIILEKNNLLWSEWCCLCRIFGLDTFHTDVIIIPKETFVSAFINNKSEDK